MEPTNQQRLGALEYGMDQAESGLKILHERHDAMTQDATVFASLLGCKDALSASTVSVVSPKFGEELTALRTENIALTGKVNTLEVKNTQLTKTVDTLKLDLEKAKEAAEIEQEAHRKTRKKLEKLKTDTETTKAELSDRIAALEVQLQTDTVPNAPADAADASDTSPVSSDSEASTQTDSHSPIMQRNTSPTNPGDVSCTLAGASAHREARKQNQVEKAGPSTPTMVSSSSDDSGSES